MAIALYSGTDCTAGNTTSVDGGSGSNRIIMLVGCFDTTDNITAVTWNGESLTKGLTQNFAAVGRYNYIWYLHNPSGTGAQNLVVTGPSDRSVNWCYVYSGVNAAPTDFVQSTANTTSITNSHTAGASDWIVGGGGNDVSVVGAGANTTIRSQSSSQGSGDSNGVASPTSLIWTCTGGNMATYGCVIAPAATATSGKNFLMFM